MTRAADILVETLRRHGVDRAFCVPGESYIAVIDALYDAPDIDLVTTRHESGATLMAVADAKMTGRPGVALVSRGPGATNASIGIHVAEQDAAPVVLFVGQVGRAELGRGAFQEVDYAKFYGGMAKFVAEVTDASELAEVARRAFHAAQSGTPGPAVISLPEDMLLDDIAGPALDPLPLDDPGPSAEEVSRICEMLAAAERPLIVAGGQVRDGKSRAALRAVSEAWQVPVAAAWRRQDVFDNTHPNYAGHFAFIMPRDVKEALSAADLVVAIGARLNDVTTQNYSFPKAPKPDQPLIHVYRDAAQLGRNIEAEIAVVAEAGPTLEALAAANAPPAPAGRAEWLVRAHAKTAAHMEWSDTEAADGVVFGNVIKALGETLGPDAVICNDAGNFSTWLHRLFPFRETQCFLGAVAGAMGFGVPAAVAAGLRDPGRQIACLVGDGGFQMTGNEISIAVERNLPVRIFVSNNGSLGTIRLYQERDYPDRTIATNLTNPDFAGIAEAYGARGLKIETAADVAPVVAEAFATDGTALVEVMTSLDYISAYSRISEIAAARS